MGEQRWSIVDSTDVHVCYNWHFGFKLIIVFKISAFENLLNHELRTQISRNENLFALNDLKVLPQYKHSSISCIFMVVSEI